MLGLHHAGIGRYTRDVARYDRRPVARAAILEVLKDGMHDLSAAIETADPGTPREEKLQLQRYHELGYLANHYRKLQRDTDLDEMDEQLDLLQEELRCRQTPSPTSGHDDTECTGQDGERAAC